MLRAGELFVSGRRKDLIIIRGRNYHPHDLEAALAQADAPELRVQSCAAFRVEQDGEPRVILMVEVRREREAGARSRELLAALRRALSAHSDVPDASIVLVPAASLPKTSSGKLRRGACARGYLDGSIRIIARSDDAPALTATHAPAELLLALRARIASWLGVASADIDPELPLAAHGLDSLQRLALHHDLEQRLGRELAPEQLSLEVPLSVLCAELQPLPDAAPDPSVRAEQPHLRAAEKLIWASQELTPGATFYHLHAALQLSGPLDPERLARALARLVAQHPRLAGAVDPDALCWRSAACPPQLVHVDARDWNDATLRADMERRVREPFDLARGPLLRVVSYARAQGHGLLVCAHHLVLDLWSGLMLQEQLLAAYEHPDLPLPAAEEPDLAALEASYLSSARAASDRAQLAEALRDVPALALWHDHPTQPDLSDAGASHVLRVQGALLAELRSFARAQGVTPFVLLLTAYKVLLHRYTQQTDFAVGTPSHGRLHQHSARLLGNCVNPLAIRTQPRPALAFARYLAQVQARVQHALRHQAFPFERLTAELAPERVPGQWPIYQTWFALHRAQPGQPAHFAEVALGSVPCRFDWGPWQAQTEPLAAQAEQFDLRLMAAETPAALSLSFQYRRALFEPETIAALAAGYLQLLQAALAAPETPIGALPLLSATGRERALTAACGAVPDAPGESFVALFARAVRAAPDATALCLGSQVLRYGELDALTNRVARRLQRMGVGPDSVVGLCARRSLALVAGMLAVLKAGAAHLALDPDHPPARLHAHAQRLAVRVVVAQAELAELWSGRDVQLLALDDSPSACADESERALTLEPHPEQLAYVLFTSGSTGEPKAVGVTQRGLARRLSWMSALHRLGPEEVVLHKTPFTFDVSVWELLWPLSAGARLVLAEPGAQLDPSALLALIERHGVTMLHFVPSMLGAFLGSPELARARGLRRIVCSGEALPAALVRRSQELLESELHNLYGPTEAAIDVSFFDCNAEAFGEQVPIGRPVPGTRLYLLDPALKPVPPGAAGELFIAGEQLARGYLGRADLSAERFLPDPHGPPGSRMYRTGDRARLDRDGRYVFLGRLDEQLKLRGVRIEPAEIELALQQTGLVADAAVRALSAPSSGPQLTAWVVPRSADVTGEVLHARLGELLPEALLPARYTFTQALPRSASGKLDVRALPAPAPLERSHRAAEGPREQQLCALFEAVLGQTRIGVDESFFALGGDSIAAITLVHRARRAGLAFSPRDVFSAPTVAGLARLAREEIPAPSALPARAAQSLTAAELSALGFTPDSVEATYPVTPMQAGLLFHSLAQAGRGVYHMQDRYTLEGPLCVERLRAALDAVFERHAVLRSAFVWDGLPEPHQLVLRGLRLPFEVHDLGALDEPSQRQQIERLLARDLDQVFELSRAPLLRVQLVRLAPERHVLLRSHHHILMDAWCTSLWLHDILTHYDALGAGLPLPAAAPAPFQAYVQWLAQRDLEPSRAYFRALLAGFDEPTPLVIARGREGAPVAEVLDVARRLSRATTERLQQRARELDVTLNTLVQGAFACLLARYADTDDVVFGVTVAGRPVELPELESTLGLFIHSLPLRVRVPAAAQLAPFLRQLLAQNVELRQHEQLPLTAVQAVSEIARGRPLFSHLLVFENTPLDPRLFDASAELHFSAAHSRTHTNYPITVVIIPGPELTLQLTCDSARIDAPAAQRMLGHFSELLSAMAQSTELRLGELPLLGAAEQGQLVHAARASEPAPAALLDFDPRRALARFARSTPRAIAVACGDERLSYAALHERVQQLAAALRARGVTPEAPVVLWAQRGTDYVTAVLGVLACAGVYVPLDPAQPAARARAILERACPGLVLCDAASQPRAQQIAGAGYPCVTLESLLQEPQVAAEARELHLEQLAYVIHTSGSTGQPKGAMVSWGGLLNHLASKLLSLRLDAHSVVAQTASQAFDISVWQLLAALVGGGRIQIYPDAVARDPLALWPALERDGVTILECVPSLLHGLLESDAPVRSLAWLLPTGEALPAALCRRFMQRMPETRVLNAYGPAECADDVSYHLVQLAELDDESAAVPIGKPVAGFELHVLDSQLRLAPLGVPGELCIAGLGVGRGYLGRPDLTAAAFVPDPLGRPGTRLYRSGDRVRRRPDGVLEFLGRIDQQLKIRGHRSEPAEVEHALCALAGVREACVVPHGADARAGSAQGLVAYVVPEHGAVLLPESLTAALRDTLPEPMLPLAFVVLPELPRNHNGKLDRGRLPAPELGTSPSGAAAPPQGAAESALCAIWSEVLRVPVVSRHDNFFALGGDSIVSIQIVSRARRAGWQLTPRQVFETPVLFELAALARPLTALEPAPPSAAQTDGALPLTPIQRWFFALRLPRPAHWNLALRLLADEPLSVPRLQRALTQLEQEHAALRLCFSGEVCSLVEARGEAPLAHVDLSRLPPSERAPALAAARAHWQQSLDLERGPLWRAVHFKLGPDAGEELLLILHHLIVDGVSLRILLEDLARHYDAALAPRAAPSLGFADWARALMDHAHVRPDEPYWHAVAETPEPALPFSAAAASDLEADAAEARITLEREDSQLLLGRLPAAYRARVQDVLLAGVARALARFTGSTCLRLDVEGHGREDIGRALDLTRSVGWFTTLYPVRLELPAAASADTLLKSIKEQLRAVPDNGLGYGLLHASGRAPRVEAAICWNYLGQLESRPAGTGLRVSLEDLGPLRDPAAPRTHALELIGLCLDGRLEVRVRYGARRFTREAIAALTAQIQAELGALAAHARTPAAHGCTPSDFPLARLAQAELDAVAAGGGNVQDVYPLAPMQEGMLLHTLLAPSSGIYLMQDRYDLRGALDLHAFRAALSEVIARHDVLRTGFFWQSAARPHQIVYRELPLPLELIDLRGLPPAAQRAHVDQVLRAELRAGLPLERAPLVRLRLFQLDDARHLFVRSHHHVLFDAWCLSPLLVELLRCYELARQGAPLPARPVASYRDYIAYLEARDVREAEAFFAAYLRGFDTPTYLAATSPRALEPDEPPVADAIANLTRAQTEHLQRLARELQLTANTFVQAAWALLLSRCTGRRDVVFGVTVAGRPPELPGIEDVIGLFINTLPLRVQVRREQTVRAWLTELLALNLQLRQHEHVPLVNVQRVSQVPNHQPLFDSFVVFENVPVDPGLYAGELALQIAGFESRTHTNYPLTVVIVPQSELHLQITYDRRVVSAELAESLVTELKALLCELVARPEQRVGELGCDEGLWHAEPSPPELSASVLEAVRAQCASTPGRVAIADARGRLEYAALARTSGQVASALRALGLAREDGVALLAARSCEYLSLLLGILRAGGVYVPLDPALPAGRNQRILREARPRWALAGSGQQAALQALLCAAEVAAQPLSSQQLMASGHPETAAWTAHAGELAYVIFTSGSTGQPKGAAVEHRGLSNNLRTKLPALALGPDDVIAQSASQSFDISIWQFLGALQCGARCEVLDDDVTHDPLRLAEAIEARGVTVFEAVPSLLAALLDAPTDLRWPALRWLIPSGEALDAALARRLTERLPHVRLLNAYGPAECSDDVSYHVLTAQDLARGVIPIGRAVAHTRLQVRSPWLEPLPAGAVGEICVSGIQVGRGYIGRPELTAEAFVPDPLGPRGARLYRTGDMGRMRADGTLEYLGRRDQQLKIRGQRVELAEIEARVRALPGVHAAAVIALGSPARLVAYVVLEPGAALTPGASRDRLRAELPEAMLPSSFVALPALPLTAAGKLDRRALAELVPAQTDALERISPRTPTERALAAIWREVLGVPAVHVHDDFFELGGHSLLATQILHRVQRELGVELSLRSVIQATSVAQLAERVDAERLLRSPIGAPGDAREDLADIEDIEL